MEMSRFVKPAAIAAAVRLFFLQLLCFQTLCLLTRCDCVAMCLRICFIHSISASFFRTYAVISKMFISLAIHFARCPNCYLIAYVFSSLVDTQVTPSSMMIGYQGTDDPIATRALALAYARADPTLSEVARHLQPFKVTSEQPDAANMAQARRRRRNDGNKEEMRSSLVRVGFVSSYLRQHSVTRLRLLPRLYTTAVQ